MRTEIEQWADRYRVPPIALKELYEILTPPLPDFGATRNERSEQNKIRAAAPLAGASLWRNNSGVARESNGPGRCPKCDSVLPIASHAVACPGCRKRILRGEATRYVRYGLGNDSRKINDRFKSPDLIGLTPVIIRPEHIGRTFGVFTGIEVKTGPTNATRLKAQRNFLNHIRMKGGIACFASNPNDYFRTLNEFINGN
jgi:hypothetical protein